MRSKQFRLVSWEWMVVEGQHLGAGLFIPHLPRSALSVAVALVGAVIMPHNIYLHSALVQSRCVPAQNRSSGDLAVRACAACDVSTCQVCWQEEVGRKAIPRLACKRK